MSDNAHCVRFPDETPDYRAARDELLGAERDLRRRVEQTAALRRKLSPGGALARNHRFEEGAQDLDEDGMARPVSLSEPFRPGKGSLLI